MFKKLGSKLKEQKGFTLIELLAVIVILGIIAAIAIPAISNVISKSHTKAEAQSGLQIINAAKLYVANTPSVTAGAKTYDNLKSYLDSVTDPTTGEADTDFTVTITETDGKFVYTLSGFGTVANEAKTEAELIKLTK
jgi:type IV pilus assembly protein PilA